MLNLLQGGWGPLPPQGRTAPPETSAGALPEKHDLKGGEGRAGTQRAPTEAAPKE